MQMPVRAGREVGYVQRKPAITKGSAPGHVSGALPFVVQKDIYGFGVGVGVGVIAGVGRGVPGDGVGVLPSLIVRSSKV